jgi:DNA-binding PadR family transcriptional regulator
MLVLLSTSPMEQVLSETDTVGSEHELTAFQQAILAILSEEARYGLAIKRELEEYYDSEVNHGRLYPNLDDLVSMGLVEKNELDKRTNEYALTEAGHAAIVDRLAWIFSRFVTDASRAEILRDLVDDAQQ